MQNIDYFVKSNPLALLTCNSQQVSEANNYLPFITGFEIECGYGQNYNVNNFLKIPNILEVRNDSSEQRYKISNGVLGILTLFHISQQLKYNSALQDSGIHYHIDCTDLKSNSKLNYNELLNFNEYILEELTKWNYKGNYNSKRVEGGASWCRINQEFSTLEFRIGEMTFDYDLLIKRIIHVNQIVYTIKKDLLGKDLIITYQDVDVDKQLNYLKNSINNEHLYTTYKEKLKNIKKPTKVDVKNRIVKI